MNVNRPDFCVFKVENTQTKYFTLFFGYDHNFVSNCIFIDIR